MCAEAEREMQYRLLHTQMECREAGKKGGVFRFELLRINHPGDSFGRNSKLGFYWRACCKTKADLPIDCSE